MKITALQLKKLFVTVDALEILFSVDGYEKYSVSWMGNSNGDFWFGLVADGSEAYNFDSFEKMLYAPVFDGKSLNDLCGLVDIIEINACPAELMLKLYLD